MHAQGLRFHYMWSMTLCDTKEPVSWNDTMEMQDRGDAEFTNSTVVTEVEFWGEKGQ